MTPLVHACTVHTLPMFRDWVSLEQALDPNIPVVRGLGELGVGDVEVLDDPLVSILEEELHGDAVLQPFYPLAVSAIKNIPLVFESIL